MSKKRNVVVRSMGFAARLMTEKAISSLASLLMPDYIDKMIPQHETYRALFPHLRSGKLWMNHAAISPLNTRTKTAIDEHLLNRSDGTIDDFPGIVHISSTTKKSLGQILNAPKDRIGFVNNTSEGLNILANGIDWKTGDRIILNDSEFPTNVVPFLNLKRFGVEIDFIKTRDGEIHFDDLSAAITSRTRLLSISFVQFLSGFKSDLTAIGALCKSRNIIFCVDAIQGVGSAPIDVQKSHIDFLSCGGHKWMLSMMGIGFIYITEELQSRIHQHSFGWMSNKHYFSNLLDYRLDPEDSARRFENGAQNNAGIVALGESANIVLEVGTETIHNHLLSLTDHFISAVGEKEIEWCTPLKHSHRAGIITFKIRNAEKLFALLNSRQITVSLREGLIRVSPHFYNTTEDIEIVCEEIKKFLL